METEESAEAVPEKRRVPAAAEGLQVNFCKNPNCSNYATPMSNEPQPRGGAGPNARRDTYKVCGDKRGTPEIACLKCGEILPMKSNLGIQEEIARLGAYLDKPAPRGCPHEGCPNHGWDVKRRKGRYQFFGRTHSGYRRYRCKGCGKTFSVGTAIRYQKKPHKNREVFSLLVNKMPMRRIMEHAGITAGTLYGKIDFFHSQSLAFAAQRERKLLEGFAIHRLDVAVDRQEYVVNWDNQYDKRNVRLQAVGSADNRTGYIFGMHVNFDPTLLPKEVERAAFECGDYRLQKPFRRHARLWLGGDYMESAKRSAKRTKKGATGMLLVDILQTYEETQGREDIEAGDDQDQTTRLPPRGMQVHAEYTLYGHFYHLRKLFGGVGKVRFYLDQESGIRAACLAAFWEEILARRCDAFYVRINKEMTVPERKAMIKRSNRELEEYQNLYPYMQEHDLRLMIIEHRLGELQPIGKWKDRWLEHPFPKMNEPEKAVAMLTDMNDYERSQLARLYARGSLHAIDRFFMQVRRMLSLTERPIGTASNKRRIWYGYSPYNPLWMIKLLDIYRVYYNFCKADRKGKTPAMRLGLARSPFKIEDILYHA